MSNVKYSNSFIILNSNKTKKNKQINSCYEYISLLECEFLYQDTCTMLLFLLMSSLFSTEDSSQHSHTQTHIHSLKLLSGQAQPQSSTLNKGSVWSSKGGL